MEVVDTGGTRNLIGVFTTFSEVVMFFFLSSSSEDEPDDDDDYIIALD